MLQRIKGLLTRKKYNFSKVGKGTSFGAGLKLFNEQYVSFGENCSIGKDCFIGCWDEYAGIKLLPKLIVGNRFYVRERMTILCAGSIVIGDAVTFAGNVLLTNENHGTDPLSESYLDNPLDVADVVIEDGVWIGENVCVLPGVTIGKKSIIGAGSIVTKSIPEYSIACGNPCRVIKKFKSGKWINVCGKE